ncbi:hypothetical protein DM860_016573 [Cuscuta australis]|uniref:Uncharacterized protein n=1 Tax=Cuscuta australis TaxID=267555 RepID=A0A328DRG4_9ASTE|nr:hypothetical protein DM860_016573 [Cuscuta australis]
MKTGGEDLCTLGNLQVMGIDDLGTLNLIIPSFILQLANHRGGGDGAQGLLVTKPVRFLYQLKAKILLFSKGLAQFLRESEDRILESSQPPLLNGTTRISGNAKIDRDEGWRCAQSERLYGREEEGQTESANKAFMDSALKLEFEKTQSHSTDGKIDQESMKQFDQMRK